MCKINIIIIKYNIYYIYYTPLSHIKIHKSNGDQNHNEILRTAVNKLFIA